MQLIEHYEVPSGGVSSITFSAIPDTFTDLYLVLSGRNSENQDQIRLLLNSSSSNFTFRMLYGTGSGVGSFSQATPGLASNWPAWQPPSGFTANTFGNVSFYIPNYTAATAKSISVDAVAENNATSGYQQINAMLWNDASAINSITLSVPSGNFAQYSSASLFGITAGSDGIVAVS